MAIQKRFIHFKKFSDFNSKKLSANEANTQYTIGVSGEVQTGAPDILYQSYCWIKDTKQQWTHGQLYSGGENSVYVTEFTLADCDAAIADGGEMQIASQQIWDAAAANKIIFIPRGDMDGGCVALSSINDDNVYLTCIDDYNSVVYHIDVSPDDIAVADSSPWKFQLRTINGQSIFGSGDTIISDYERKVVVNAGQTWQLVVDYKFMITNTLNGPLTIQLPTTNPTSDNYTKECGITFTTGSTAPTITFNGDIWWVNGTAPTIDANCVYEFSFKFNFANNTWLGVYASFKTA